MGNDVGVRITVRRLMAAIAAVALSLSAIRVMWPLLAGLGNPIVEALARRDRPTVRRRG